MNYNNIWITTYTGKRFHVLDPQPSDFCIEDIAHALSLICRYCGHCREFYSVADHSVRLTNLVPVEMKLEALMHDSAEAYLGDVPKPYKSLFSGYEELEHRLMDRISSKFNLVCHRYDDLKKYENQLLAAEVRDLMPNSIGWHLPEPAFPEFIVPLSSAVCEESFLRYFKELQYIERRK